MKKYWSLLFLSLYVHRTVQISSQTSPTYKAAVVEYSPEFYNISAADKDVFTLNALHYVEFIKEAASKSVDIIVFPECGLSTLSTGTEIATFVPGPEDNANPCTNDSIVVDKALRLLSCAARDHRIYVAVNIHEKKSCASSGKENCMLYYNTNVVFDRTGQVVARYRKFNLFGEPGFNITKEPDISVFETDFGVKFGIFICFDIIFEKPAVSLVKDLGITDIIYSTAWFSELPFLSAVQEQAAWAHAMDVNFLGAGYNRPFLGSTGSGIYAGKLGPLTSIMAFEFTSQMLVADVPKKSARSNQFTPKPIIQSSSPKTGLLMLKDYLQPYTTKLLPKEDTDVREKVCNGKLCCDFEVKQHVGENNFKGQYVYRLAVFDGVRSYTYKTGGIQVCAVIFCLGENLEECAVPSNFSQPFSFIFESIRISGEFQLKNATQLPNTLVNNYNVLSPIDFKFERQEFPLNNSVQVTMELLTLQASLLTFGIYSRDFMRDGLNYTESVSRTSESNGSAVTLSLITVAFALLLIIMLNKITHHN